MLRTFTNTDHQARVWPNISCSHGPTLFLLPGESCDLDLPTDFTDPHLAPAKPVKQTRKDTPEPAATADPKE